VVGVTPDLGLAGYGGVVTGGALGIGAACVRALAGAGAGVVIADLDFDAAARLAEELGGDTIAVRADIREAADCESMVAAAVQRFGALRFAVNSAGVLTPRKADLAETGLDAWRLITDVDLTGMFLSLKAEIAAMVDGGGSIINVASALGTVGSPGRAPYVAAKHGVLGLTRTAAIEYARRGVRINAVGPGGTDTAALAYNDEAARAAIAASQPIGRLATPEEMGRAIALLLSPSLSFMTGAFIPLDGGYLAQ
jgi:NAD(P)-dependent dehydrogenase (short-subunit alcohol dehydrogenase family)